MGSAGRVSGLLPRVIERAVTSKSVLVASQSFGVVALTLVVVFIVEHEVLRVARTDRARRTGLSVFAVPLLVAVALTIAARLALFIH